ncbi:MAG: MarC family protein [Flavobacteriaceae bacterium]|nr:MarC family protein [Flavobacteriaceae bacterium]
MKYAFLVSLLGNLASSPSWQLNFDFEQILSAFLVLFAIIDIIGSVPLIVSLHQKSGEIQAAKASIVAGVLLILFLFIGERMLNLLGIDVYSFAVAGALVVFLLALEMIMGIELNKIEEPKSVSIVPIAFPLVAGAGSLTTVLSIRAEYSVENIIVAIILNMIIVYIVLKFAKKLEKLLSKAILDTLKKVFGIVLLAISIKLFTTNLNFLIERL